MPVSSVAGGRQRDQGRLELPPLGFRAEFVIDEGGEGRRIDRDAHLGLGVEATRRRAIEEIGGEVNAFGVPVRSSRVRGELDLELLGHEILDRELDPADRCALGIDVRRDRPAAAPRRFGQAIAWWSAPTANGDASA